jgi:hypothetical protein
MKLTKDFQLKIKKHLNKKFDVVQSSLLQETYYDQEEEILLVKFANADDIYLYNLPLSVYKSFCMSESKGSFFSRKIKKNYPWCKIENDIVQKAQPSDNISGDSSLESFLDQTQNHGFTKI